MVSIGIILHKSSPEIFKVHNISNLLSWDIHEMVDFHWTITRSFLQWTNIARVNLHHQQAIRLHIIHCNRQIYSVVDLILLLRHTDYQMTFNVVGTREN